jgi:hypothetical protein
MKRGDSQAVTESEAGAGAAEVQARLVFTLVYFTTFSHV